MKAQIHLNVSCDKLQIKILNAVMRESMQLEYNILYKDIIIIIRYDYSLSGGLLSVGWILLDQTTLFCADIQHRSCHLLSTIN